MVQNKKPYFLNYFLIKSGVLNFLKKIKIKIVETKIYNKTNFFVNKKVINVETKIVKNIQKQNFSIYAFKYTFFVFFLIFHTV